MQPVAAVSYVNDIINQVKENPTLIAFTAVAAVIPVILICALCSGGKKPEKKSVKKDSDAKPETKAEEKVLVCLNLQNSPIV